MSGEEPGRQSRGAALEAAWDVARRMQAFGTYGSEEAARRALTRRCPGLTARRCRNALAKAVVLYDAAAGLVAYHLDSLAAQTDVRSNQFPDFRRLVQALRPQCRGFRASTYRAALSWAYYWNHLR